MNDNDNNKGRGQQKPSDVADETSRPSIDRKAKQGAVEPSSPDSDVPGGTAGSH